MAVSKTDGKPCPCGAYILWSRQRDKICIENLKCYIYTPVLLKHRYARSVQKVPSQVIGKIETFFEEDTRYKKHHTQDNDASVPFKVGTLGPHTVLPGAISCPIVFS